MPTNIELLYSERLAYAWVRKVNFFFFFKLGQPRPLFRLFSVFSNKQHNFYNKSMWTNPQMSIHYTAPGLEHTTFLHDIIHLVSGGIWTLDLSLTMTLRNNCSLLQKKFYNISLWSRWFVFYWHNELRSRQILAEVAIIGSTFILIVSKRDTVSFIRRLHT